MTPPADNQSDAPRVAHCLDCGAALAPDQRYCVHCGARRFGLPAAIASLIAAALPGRFARPEAHATPAATTGASTAAAAEHERWLGPFEMPSPRTAAIATLAVLAFGVIVGSAVSPTEQTGASGAIVLAVSPPPAPSSPAGLAPVASAPLATPSPTPPATPPQQTVTVVSNTSTGTTGPTGASGPGATATVLPDVRHVFLIVLSDQGYNQAFGPTSQAPYLAQTLTKQGELISNYYAVAPSELANGVALISGQGPNPQTAANCPNYTDVSPGTPGASDGQITGSGCVYPKTTLTLPDELVSAGKTWKAYAEDIGNGPASEAKTCRHPAAGAADPDYAPRSGDAYVTWRDPFVYFHSIVDTPGCATSVVGLDQLATDLKTPATAPALVYVIPNRCHDGSDQPCAPGQPSGLPEADAFLKTVVPEIEQSAAYKDNGLIAITFDQAPQSGPNADSSSCCAQPAYPNLPAGATGASGASGSSGASGASGPTGASGATGSSGSSSGGGGQVGLLLISSFVKPGSVNVFGNYNHFSLLRDIEDLFSLQPTGYAGTTGLPTFNKSVYNASTTATG